MIHFFDANVFVYATQGAGADAERSKEALHRLRSGEWTGITSVLVVDEVWWSLWKHQGREASLEAVEDVYRTPNLVVQGVDAAVPQRATAVSRRYGLKPRDAIHVATMLEHGVYSIVSADPDFDKVREIRRVELPSPKRR